MIAVFGLGRATPRPGEPCEHQSIRLDNERELEALAVLTARLNDSQAAARALFTREDQP